MLMFVSRMVPRGIKLQERFFEAPRREKSCAKKWASLEIHNGSSWHFSSPDLPPRSLERSWEKDKWQEEILEISGPMRCKNALAIDLGWQRYPSKGFCIAEHTVFWSHDIGIQGTTSTWKCFSKSSTLGENVKQSPERNLNKKEKSQTKKKHHF